MAIPAGSIVLSWTCGPHGAGDSFMGLTEEFAQAGDCVGPDREQSNKEGSTPHNPIELALSSFSL